MNNKKAGFHILISIFAIAILTTIFVFILPKTSKSIANKIKNVDEKIAQENVVDNYKAEYEKLVGKKKDIEKMMIDFKAQIEVHTQKIATEKKILAEFKKLLTRYQTENNPIYFKSTLLQYNSQKMKIETLTKIKNGCRTGLKNLEKALAKIDVSINEMKANLDTVAYKKLLTDAYKDINKMLESIKGIGTDGCTVDVEKLNEEFIKEGVKMDVLTESETPVATSDKPYTSEEMKKIVDGLK